MDISFTPFSFGKNHDSDRKTLLNTMGKVDAVLLDEKNAGKKPHEKLINSMIMGTDENGKKPEKPAPVIIGTQNSISESGRDSDTPAEKARFATYHLEQYPKDELKLILLRYGVEGENAEYWAEQFVLATTFAIENHRTVPSINDLFKAAGVVLEEEPLNNDIQPENEEIIPDEQKNEPDQQEECRKLFYSIVHAEKFWKGQTFFGRSQPTGIDEMLKNAKSAEEININNLQSIAKTRLANTGFTFFSQLTRDTNTKSFYKLLQEAPADDFDGYAEKLKNFAKLHHIPTNT